MASNSRQPTKNRAPIADSESQPPFETKELRKGLKALLDTTMRDPITKKPKKVGSYKYGVYAFYDYDSEPIYVGQTRERLGGRVGRHLTNQRTDAVAMSVLDPFEVCDVELFPIPELESPRDGRAIIAELNSVEAAVYRRLLSESRYNAVLNEKIPVSYRKVKLPASVRGRIVSDEVMIVRSHPDTRLARRAATIARLSQIIGERKVGAGLRRVLVIQAKRLLSLAERRYRHFEGQPDGDYSDEE